MFLLIDPPYYLQKSGHYVRIRKANFAYKHEYSNSQVGKDS